MGKQSTVYQTHWNGGRPLTVKIEGSVVVEDNEEEEDGKVIGTFRPQRVLIGKSPLNRMTEFSGGHGDKFDGNSILLDLGNREYVFICEKLRFFHAEHDIHTFVSPVGNNDVPYPYAIDSRERYYLLIEDVILERVPPRWRDDPYRFYYRQHIIVHCPYCDGDKYRKFWIGNEEYRLTYKAKPSEDYDRFLEFPDNPEKTVSVETLDGQIVELSKQDYIDIHTDFGREKGYTNIVWLER